MNSRRRAAISLLLLVPAPALGVAAGMLVFPDSALGRGLYAAAKLWFLALPAAWWLLVERERPSLSPARRGGWTAGLLSGLAISAVILAGYRLFGAGWIDREFFRAELARVGLAVPLRYALGATYWTLVNSLLEEYAWRWFCVRQCEQLWSRRTSIVVSALFFTAHHVVALSVFVPAPTVALASAGVFVGGMIWSAMYLRYRSIWPGYLSHAIVDLAIFGLGAFLLFGGG